MVLDAASFLGQVAVLVSLMCCFNVYRVENAVGAPSSVQQHSAPQHTVSVTANPSHPASPSSSNVPPGVPTLPLSGWLTGKAVILEKGFKITRAFIYDYFVECCHHKNGPTNNFRALKSGYNMFASGHVHSVQMAISGHYTFYKSKILPSMKKDKPYDCDCCIHNAKKSIVSAHCSCPAGISESCVHVSALLHSLECLFEHPRNSSLVASAVGESKTSQECEWLKPRKRKVDATRAADLLYVKHEYGKKKRKKLPTVDFDPRPPTKRNAQSVDQARKILAESIKGSNVCADFLLNN